MKIKKFWGKTLHEATELMKKNMGKDSVILSTRIVEKNTPQGIIKYFEITSGVEETDVLIEDKVDSIEDEYLILNKENDRNEVDEINSLKEEIVAAKDFGKKNNTIEQNDLNEISEILLFREVKEAIVKLIIEQILKSKHLLNQRNLDDYVTSCISSMIYTKEFYVDKKKRPMTVALVGPTGVGKTTSIAKLAAISKILHNLEVGILSIDTYRLGAIDQLRIFSEISNIEMLVAYEPKEVVVQMNKLKNKDIVFIDTVGRSQKNIKELKSIKNYLEQLKIDETILVLSSTSSTKNLYESIDKFKMFGINSLLISKIDEAAAFGNILNVSYDFEIPIMFLTNGQVIPDDIISADKDYIAKLIYKRNLV
ncbi:hypothetical protein ABRY23_12420 [Melioribacteraceae bacterium 4301-Me]|uniref:hypothetical protein n=1 Tax=Pyranulibacter aquaticus TaxID=3163344 RepID=UPI0035971E51